MPGDAKFGKLLLNAAQIIAWQRARRTLGIASCSSFKALLLLLPDEQARLFSSFESPIFL